MAVTPKHNDIGKHYDPTKELSNDQRHRFTEIANKAAERRAQKAAEKKRRKASEAKAHEPEHDEEHKPKRHSDWPRTIAWTLVLGALWLWIMIMTQ